MGWGIAETASEIEKIKSESADYLNGLNSCGVIDWNTYNYAFDFYADLLMKAYEQGKKDAQLEPCEDAVSRKAVYEAMIEKGQHSRRYKLGEIWELNGTEIREALDTVPSVTPKRKTGKWIEDMKRFGDDAYHCDQCGAILEEDALNWRNNYFCYHCGADMRGKQDE